MKQTITTDIDWSVLHETRERFGSNFYRHFTYLTHDGPRSVQAIEDAMRAMNPAQMILPANRLSEDAFLFGATALGELAEMIEHNAQLSVAAQSTSDDMLRDVLALRPLYFTSVARLEREISPLVRRKCRAAQHIERSATMQFV